MKTYTVIRKYQGDTTYIIKENNTIKLKVKHNYSTISNTFSGLIFEIWDDSVMFFFK